MVVVELVMIGIVIALLFCYLNIRNTYSTWLKYNIPFEKAQFPYGNVKDVGKTMNIFEFTTNLYKKMKNESPLAGFHVLTKPAIVVTNLDAVQQILITDSNAFMNRGMYVNLLDDPLSGNLFNFDGSKHKELRNKLTPIFTSGNNQMLYQSMEQMADRLLNCITDLLEDSLLDMDVKDILTRYTTDVMGKIFLGIDCNVLKDENAELQNIGKTYLAQGRERGLKYFFRNTFQDVAKQLKIRETPKPVTDFFFRTIKETFVNRETTNSKQNDLIDLLMQLKSDGEWNASSKEKSGIITFDEAVAHSFIFYVAGFETTSSTLSFCLYELAKNQEIQDNIRKHVATVWQRTDNKPHYGTFSELKYLDQVINETLRKYPPAPVVYRTATSDYQLPNTNMIIPTGTQVMIPIYAVHHDENIYPKPEQYNPDRFANNETTDRHFCSFMPFGIGKRQCIGMEFAMMELRITLAHLIRKFRFSIGSKTQFPLKFDKKSSVLTINDMWLTVENFRPPVSRQQHS